MGAVCAALNSSCARGASHAATAEGRSRVRRPPPDWANLAEDVHCPLCDYNLRGLIKPRCPECGYRSEWPELLDPTKRLHPYLFEHHPERDIRSFWHTLIVGLRPRRFWQTLYPTQPLVPRRLVFHWFAAWTVYLAALAGCFIAASGHEANRMNTWQAAMAARLNNPANAAQRALIMRQRESVDFYLDSVHPLTSAPAYLCRWVYSENFYPLKTIPLLWPWLTFGALMTFQMSMRQARIRPMHVLRCVLYSYDVVVWMGVTLAVAYVSHSVIAGDWGLLVLAGDAMLAIAAGLVLAAYRLWIACRIHLRLEDAFATVLASQVITILLMPIVVFVLPKALL